MGIVLLIVPPATAYYGKLSLDFLFVGGLGIAVLVLLFLYRPVERIHNLMIDLSKLTIMTNSYQQQVGLRLLEVNLEDRETLDKAAAKINEAATNTTNLIGEYYE